MAKNYLRVPILNDEYAVIVCWGTSSEVGKALRRWHYPKEEHEAAVNWLGDTMRGLCFYRSDCHPVVALPAVPKTAAEIGTLAHEATHAVCHLMEKMGADDDELRAHSVGAVVRHTLAHIEGLGV